MGRSCYFDVSYSGSLTGSYTLLGIENMLKLKLSASDRSTALIDGCIPSNHGINDRHQQPN